MVNSNITVLGFGNNVPVQMFKDINNDKRADVVLSNGTNIVVMLGNVDGSFQTPVSTPLGIDGGLTASEVRLADVDGDKLLDFIVVKSNSIQVKKGLASDPGKFGPTGNHVRFEYGSGWNGFDAAGILDIADVGCADGKSDYLWTDKETTWIKPGAAGEPAFGRMRIQDTKPPANTIPASMVQPNFCAFASIASGRGNDRICVTATHLLVHRSLCRGLTSTSSQASLALEEASEAATTVLSSGATTAMAETSTDVASPSLYLGRRKWGHGLQQLSSPH
jgi:hypothetical protein